MYNVVVRSAMSIGQSHVDRPILAFDNTNINVADHFFHNHVFRIKDSGECAGSMRTGASSGAETIHFNGEVLEYQIQGNQRSYCAVHTRQLRMYGIMPYAVCRMKYAVREYASSLIIQHIRQYSLVNISLILRSQKIGVHIK